MFQRWFVTFTAAWLCIGVVAAGQDRATVQLRDGSKFEGRIEEMTANELFVRVSQNDQRRVPISSVALIDRVGSASGLPDTELREATGPQHLLLLHNGSSVKGRLLAIRGGEGSADGNAPRTYVFRAADGGERVFPPEQVSRVYFGTYPIAAITGSVPPSNPSDLDEGSYVPGAVRVPAASGWVSTGMRVGRVS